MVNRVDLKSLSQFSKKPPSLSHLKQLTTPLGIVQHSRGSVPDLGHGYSIDDAARALIVCVWYAELFDPKNVQDLAPIYLKHLSDAQLPTGRFHNFKDRVGKFIDDVGSDDSFGRTIWSLGVALHTPLVNRSLVKELLKKALSPIHTLNPPRSVAFSLLGSVEIPNHNLATVLGDKLLRCYREHAQPDWQWFEPCLYYSNAILPYSLLMAGGEFHQTAIDALRFLNRVSRIDGMPSPIGFEGWYCRGGNRAQWGQQPIDAADMVIANLKAFELSGDNSFLKEAVDWLNWFYGFNVRKAYMISKTGGCYDGIWEKKINKNQGAESVVVYLLAHLALVKTARRLLESHR